MARSLKNDMNKVGESYGAHVVKTTRPEDWPGMDNVVVTIAKAVWEALKAAAAAGDDVDKLNEVRELSYRIERAWPMWRDVVSRMSVYDGTPLSVLQDFAHNVRHGGMRMENFQQAFLMAHGKVRELVMGAAERAMASSCEEDGKGGGKICDGYRRLLEAARKNSSVLAMPKFINDLFVSDGEVILTGADFQMAGMIISKYAFIDTYDKLDDGKLAKMVDSMLIQVQRWGDAKVDNASFSFDSERREEKEDWDPSVAFREGHASLEAWAKPSTIVFASILLWTLHGKATGTR
jgi:hypothetical protein